MRRTAVVLATNLIVGAAALVYLLHRFGTPAVLLLGRHRSIPFLLAFCGVVLVALAIDAWRWRVLLVGLGERPGMVRLAAFRAAGQSLSALLPSAKLGGEPVRMFLLARERVSAARAIASVAVDRTVELGTSTTAACVFAALLLRQGVPALGSVLLTLGLGTLGLGVGIGLTVRRLRRGAGLVTAFARRTRLDRLGFVRDRLGVLAEAEAAAAHLVAEPGLIAIAFGAGVVGTVCALLEYHLLLAAFQLPHTPIAIVAAVFATGAAHALPVPAGVGVLEGAMLWLFTALGHPPAVGLAIGFVARLREVVWVLPGLLYLAAHDLVSRRRAAPAPVELRAVGGSRA